MRTTRIILITIMIMASCLQADEIRLTIDEAIEIALNNNTGYLIEQQKVEQSRQRVRQNLGFLPQVTLEGARTLDEKLMQLEMPPFMPGGEPQTITLDFTKNYEFTLRVVQPVFTGGKIWYSFKNAAIDLKLAKEKRRDSEQDLILDVKRLFYNVLVMKELVKAHREALEIAQRNLANVEESYRLGMVSRYDMLRAELAVSAVKPQLENARKLLQMIHVNLKTMLGIDHGAQLVLDGELSYREHELELPGLIETALEQRSEIRQLDMERLKTDNLLKMSLAQFIPDFSIIASYSFRSDRLAFSSSDWESFYTINLGISFPIFTGLRRSGQIGEMKVLKKIMDLTAEQLRDGTRLEVRNLFLTLKEEFKNIELGEKNITTAGEGVRIAELNYQEGLITILELNSSQRELTQARVAYLQAIYNYTITLAKLEKLTGTKLTGGTQ